MPVQMIALANPRAGAEDDMQTYIAAAVPMLESAGGTIVNRYRTVAEPVGSDGPAMILHMEFPDADSVNAVFTSDAYSDIVEVRDRGFERLTVVVSEVV